MSYSTTSLVTVGGLEALATKTKTEIKTLSSQSIKSAKLENNTIKFYYDTAKTNHAADLDIDLPAELYLDQFKTTFVSDFKFSAATYEGAEDPELDGNPVLVLAVKDDTNNTYTYSFIDLTYLTDFYTVNTEDDTVSEKVLDIDGYKVKFKISAVAGNLLSTENDGLYLGADGTKADKVTRTNPYMQEDNPDEYAAFNAYSMDGSIALLTANGNLKDSEVKIATTAEVDEMIENVFNPAADPDPDPEP